MLETPDKKQNNDVNILLNEILLFLESNKRQHHLSEDCWYTCPKHPEGCCNPEESYNCNCGADEYNEQVDKLINKLKKHLT